MDFMDQATYKNAMTKELKSGRAENVFPVRFNNIFLRLPDARPLSYQSRVRETFELNQLKSAPSQLLPVFSGFDRLPTCCHSFGPANILYVFFPSAG